MHAQVVHVPLWSHIDGSATLCTVRQAVRYSTHLDITPPIAALRAGAFCEVDLLLRVGGVEGVLLAHSATVAVE